MRLAPLLLSLVTGSIAAPATFFDDAYDFSDELSEFYGRVSNYINTVVQDTAPTGSCNPSNIALPPQASSLPSPDGLQPMYVALGRGTQVCNLQSYY